MFILLKFQLTSHHFLNTLSFSRSKYVHLAFTDSVDRRIHISNWMIRYIESSKIDFTAILFLLVQNRQQTHDWTLIGSGANGLGIHMIRTRTWRPVWCLLLPTRLVYTQYVIGPSRFLQQKWPSPPQGKSGQCPPPSLAKQVFYVY